MYIDLLKLVRCLKKYRAVNNDLMLFTWLNILKARQSYCYGRFVENNKLKRNTRLIFYTFNITRL